MKKKLLLPFLGLLLVSILRGESVRDTLIIGYTQASPFIIKNKGELEGISIWLWDKIASDLEISYEYREMKFGEMLKGLENGEIDLSINPLTMTSERSKRMQFTHSFFASNSTVAIRRASSFQKFFQFVYSFLSGNFLRGMVGLIIIITCFGLTAWLFERKANPSQFRSGWTGVWDGLWWSAVTMTTVGYGDKSPKTTGGKVVALIWMFTAIMFISGFTASIASSLTVNQLQWNPKGIEDFKEQKTGTVSSTGTAAYLKAHFFKNIELFDGLKAGLKALLAKKIDAFLYDEPIMTYRIAAQEEFSKLEILPIRFDLQFYAFAFSENHDDLEEKVSQKILEYTEGIEWRYILAEYKLSEL